MERTLSFAELVLLPITSANLYISNIVIAWILKSAAE